MIVIKKDGKKVKFDKHKIRKAVYKAALAVREAKEAKIDAIMNEVERRIPNKQEITVEEIKDIVEQSLVALGEYKIAKAMILYREKRNEARRLAASLGTVNDLKVGTSSIIVLSKRYLLRDEKGHIKETPKQMFQRVARTVASVEEKYGGTQKDVRQTARRFFDLMTQSLFLPNSPTLMNAGTPLGQLSACFVIPIQDSIDSIFGALHLTAKIHQTGGGTGFNFSKLRPSGDVVRSTGGVASGPVSFLRVFDAATQQIKQGGKRRGANMGILNCNHQDIFEFITCKADGSLSNFNISVGITDSFLKAVNSNTVVELKNPRNNEVAQKVPARAIFDLLVAQAWKTGDPGLLFLDTINSSRSNVVPKLGPIEATNPCGELPLYPYESCNLGSVNLARMVQQGQDGPEVNWTLLENTVRESVHFLDNVIDANKYIDERIRDMTLRLRRIGLGVMGWADMLVQLGIPYNSTQAEGLAGRIMKFITEVARDESVKLAKSRGSFPEFKDSIWPKQGFEALRNAAVTCIAPTGSISIILGASPSIEPLFSIVTIRDLRDSIGSELVDMNPYFEEIAIERGFYSDELIKKLAGNFSIQRINEIPEDVKRVFVTAHDIQPEWHVRMQAAFQTWTDNAVSKTVNLPFTATPRDVEDIFFLAWKLGCKGITVFRTGCKDKQVYVCKECETGA